MFSLFGSFKKSDPEHEKLPTESDDNRTRSSSNADQDPLIEGSSLIEEDEDSDTMEYGYKEVKSLRRCLDVTSEEYVEQNSLYNEMDEDEEVMPDHNPSGKLEDAPEKDISSRTTAEQFGQKNEIVDSPKDEGYGIAVASVGITHNCSRHEAQQAEIIQLQKLQLSQQSMLYNALLHFIRMQGTNHQQTTTAAGNQNHINSKAYNKEANITNTQKTEEIDDSKLLFLQNSSVEIQQSLKLLLEEQVQSRKRYELFARNLYNAHMQQIKELKSMQALLIDSVRELRQNNLQSGEDLKHQKARLQSYKVRKYDSFTE